MSWSQIFNFFMKVSFFATLALIPVLVLILVTIQYQDEPTSTFWSFAISIPPYLNISKGVAVNILSASVVFLIFNALYYYIHTNKVSEADEQFFSKLDKVFESKVRKVLAIKNISYFKENFHDISWGERLNKAKRVDLAAVFWSTEWMKDNLSAFAQAKQIEEINIYISHPLKFSSEYVDEVPHSLETQRKIFKCAYEFSNGNDNINVMFLEKLPSYMYAKLHYKESAEFLFSPYQISRKSKAGRPPAIGISMVDAGEDFINFVDEELEAISSSIVDYELMDIDKYIHWSDDGQRVIVSLALSCSARCEFCYVPSLSNEKEDEINDQELFGHALVHHILLSDNFKSGKTKIFVGGLTDPFLKSNKRRSIAFFKCLSDHKIPNIVHVATRFKVFPEVLAHIGGMKNIIFSFSFSHQDRSKAKEIDTHKLRLEQNQEIGREFITSIYLRPIIPKLTENSLEYLCNVGTEYGIKNIILGNLYYDESILSRSNLTEDDFRKAKKLPKRMVLDKKGVLTKIDQEQTRLRIAQTLESKGFEVHENASDFVHWASKKI